jgi:hypothetical protein
MKTTKKVLRAAVDSFLYRYDWLTGGTAKETAAQAPSSIADLEKMAATVAELAANPNKAAASDAHLMDYALRMVPMKLALYRRHVPGTAEHAEREAELAAKQEREEREFSGLLAMDRLVAAASAILGVEVEEILAGAETVPTNIIPFRRVA